MDESQNEDGETLTSRTSPESETDYDIFMSYSSVDEDDVKPLYEELEQKYHLKCMVADRDYTPGLSIDQNCEIHMKKSKKVVFIFTPGFIDSMWCEREFIHAQMTKFKGSQDCIIPILLKPVDQLPTFMQYYTYIDASKVDDLAYKIVKAFHNQGTVFIFLQ